MMNKIFFLTCIIGFQKYPCKLKYIYSSPLIFGKIHFTKSQKTISKVMELAENDST